MNELKYRYVWWAVLPISTGTNCVFPSSALAPIGRQDSGTSGAKVIEIFIWLINQNSLLQKNLTLKMATSETKKSHNHFA